MDILSLDEVAASGHQHATPGHQHFESADDYKTAGVERERLQHWAEKVDWDTLLNRAGTTFRKLPDKDKAALNESKAIKLTLDQPSMIKRPVLDLGGGKLLVGFKPESYARRCLVDPVKKIPAADVMIRFPPAGSGPPFRLASA